MDEDTVVREGDTVDMNRLGHVTIVKIIAGPSPDDELDVGTTDQDGRFTVEGSDDELTTIDPRIKIFHDCNDHGVVSGTI